MSVEITYKAFRKKLGAYLDRVTDDCEVVIVRRADGRDVACVAADELSSLLETAHLLRSPKNAERLFDSLRDLDAGAGETISLDELRQSIGLKVISTSTSSRQ